MLKWKPHPLLSPPTEAEVAAMEPKQLQELWQTYHDAIANAERDPYRYGFKLPHWTEAENVLDERNEILVSGGNRCVCGSTTYVFNPDTKSAVAMKDVWAGMPVLSYDDTTGKIERATCDKPFIKGREEMLTIEFSDGASITCTKAHRFVNALGHYVSAGSLSVGDGLLSCSASQTGAIPLGIQLPYGRPENCKDEGSLCGCQSESCFCDEQPRLEAGIVQGVFPSQDDARQHSLAYRNSDGAVDGEGGSRDVSYAQCNSPSFLSPSDEAESLSHLGLDCNEPQFHPACIPGQPYPSPQSNRFQSIGDKTFGTECCVACTEPKRSEHRHQGLQQFGNSSFPKQPEQKLPRDSSSFSSSEYIIRVNSISSAGVRDVWDTTVEPYGNYLANGVFHHNSSKTSWAAHAVVRAAVENPGAVIMCFAQNAEVSIRQQQSAIYDALPEELRRKTLGAEENVSYSRKNGFSKGSLILPGSLSHIIFKTYAQFSNKPDILEGAELGSYDAQWINIGAWCDEYLIGPELLATLRFRLATRNSKMIVTFTPVDGYTETVRDYLEGAKTIKSRPAELLNNRPVPFVQHSKNRDAGIIYFHSQDNPFGGYDRIAKDLRGRPEHEILVRAYGVPVKSASSRFPLFDRGVNVIAHDKIPRENVTRYMILDPAGRKNWFMCWVTVDATDTYYVEREWPDQNVGEWAEWKGGKWISGQGAKGLGFGIKDYVDLILREEEGVEIFERLIDPRLGAAKYQAQDGASSIIEDLADAGLIFLPAPGLDIEDGIQALQTKMAYNIGKPIDALNRPHFYVSDRCQNIIHALQEYTGDGGSDEAWKDPIDTLRYCAIAGCAFIDPAKMKSSKPKGGY